MRRRGEQPQRLSRVQPRHLRGHADAAYPQAALRQLLLGGRDRALPARRPRPRGRRGRVVRHRYQHPQGAARRQEDGRVQALQGPGERHRLKPGRRHRVALRKAARRLPGALRLARRQLRQVPPRGRVASTAVVTALGCDAGGWRRVLGVDVADTESYDSWLAFLRTVRGRSVSGVELVVSNARPGLVRALGEFFRGAAWQRCAVHLMRDCMREAGSWQLRRRVGRIVSQVFRGRDAAIVAAMYHAACDMLEECCPRAAAVLEEAEPDALAYLDFPPTHWKRLRTNNVQERTNREVKRRTRVVQVFPSTGSLVPLAGAVMCEQDEIWQESRYFSEARMNEIYDEGRRRGIEGPVDWAQLEAEARKMIEAGLELADRVETA